MGSGNAAVTLALQGTMTIARADEIRAEILDALRANQAVAIDCGHVEEIDVTFLQLLIAAHRTAEQLGKTLHFRAPPSSVLAEAMARCGFQPVVPTTSLAQSFSLPIQAQS